MPGTVDSHPISETVGAPTQPFPVEDVYALATTELLLSSSTVRGGDGDPEECGGAPAATGGVKQKQSLESRTRACLRKTANRRRVAWLAAVVLLTFCVQVALAALVLQAALPADPAVPDWYSVIGSPADNPFFSPPFSRHQQVERLLAAIKEATPEPVQLGAGSDGEGSDWTFDRVMLEGSCDCDIVVSMPPQGERVRPEDVNVTDCISRFECFLCSYDLRSPALHVGSGSPKCDVIVEQEGTTRLPAANVAAADDLAEKQGVNYTPTFFAVWSKLAQAEEEILHKLLGQLVHNPPSLTMMSITVSFAVVLVAVSVHREVARAHALARLVLTHTGCMPPFFAPLALAAGPGPAVGASHISWRKRLLVALALLALPLLQLSAALCVLVSASTVFALADQTKQLISIVFNSAALLFVLELDNVVGSLAKHHCRMVGLLSASTSPDELELQEELSAGAAKGGSLRVTGDAATLGAAPGRRRRLSHVVGHAYVALLGLLGIAELFFATSGLAWAYLDAQSIGIIFKSALLLKPVSIDSHRYDGDFRRQRFPLLDTFISPFRSSAAAVASFAVLFTLTVALLFDPPLPTHSTLWTVSAKVALTVTAALLSVAFNMKFKLEGPNGVVDASNAATSAAVLGTYALKTWSTNTRWLWASALVALCSWLVLYAIVPWAQPCHTARRQHRLKRRSVATAAAAEKQGVSGGGPEVV